MQKHKNSTNDSPDDWNSVLVREKEEKINQKWSMHHPANERIKSNQVTSRRATSTLTWWSLQGGNVISKKFEMKTTINLQTNCAKTKSNNQLTYGFRNNFVAASNLRKPQKQ